MIDTNALASINEANKTVLAFGIAAGRWNGYEEQGTL